MGFHAMAYSVIGVRIPVNANSFGQSKIPSCNHSFDVTDANFCPKCGKPVEIIDNALSQFAYRDDFEGFLEKELHTVFANVAVTHKSYDDNDDIVVGVGILSAGSASVQNIPLDQIPSFDEIKMHLKNILEPFGIYDETSFGLYSVLR